MTKCERSLLAIYMRVWPEDDEVGKDSSRDADIIADMRKVVAAPSLDAACEAIEWWGPQDEDGDTKTHRRRVARVRAMAKTRRPL